jgi:hypothetical protein
MREHKAELLAVLGVDEPDLLPSVVPTKPPPVMRNPSFVGVGKTAFQKSAGESDADPLAETHADREIRRFLSVCRPWPDGRGWYDPTAAWLPGVREYFEYLRQQT